MLSPRVSDSGKAGEDRSLDPYQTCGNHEMRTPFLTQRSTQPEDVQMHVHLVPRLDCRKSAKVPSLWATAPSLIHFLEKCKKRKKGGPALSADDVQQKADLILDQPEGAWQTGSEPAPGHQG